MLYFQEDREGFLEKIKNATITGRASWKVPEDVGEAVENKVIEEIVNPEEPEEEK